MRALKRTILIGLLFAGLTMPCSAEPSPADKIQYHWVTENKVILWQTLADADPVTAEYNPQSNLWSGIPTNSGTPWRTLLEGTVRRYKPNVKANNLSMQQLWGFVLAKLHNGDNIAPWAQPREPSAEMYLVPKGQASVELVVNSKVSNVADRRQSVVFDQSRGKWIKKDSIPLEGLLGIDNVSSELRKILSIPANDKLPDGPNTWADTWNKWITNYLVEPSAVRTIMYKDVRGNPQWLWVERLVPGGNPPAGSRLMPQIQNLISEPPLEEKNGDVTTPSFDWLKWSMIGLGALLIILILFLVIEGRRLWYSVRWLAGGIALLFRRNKSSDKVTTPDTGQPAVVAVDTLERIHTLVKERLGAVLQDASIDSKWLTGMVEFIHGEYIKAATSKSLLQEVEAQRAEQVKQFLQKEVGVETTDGKQLKRWVDLGRGAETVASTTDNGLTLPEEVRSRMAGKISAARPSQQELLNHWPEILMAYSQCLSEQTIQYQALNERLVEQSGQFNRAVMTKETEVNGRWQNQVTELKREKGMLEGKLTKADAELRSSKGKITELEEQVTTLQNQLETANRAKEAAQAGLTPFEEKMTAIRDIQILSSYMRQWMQGYFDAHMKDNSEIRPVAVVAALMNFSLNQMCFSVIKGQHELRRVMAHNVFRLAQMFEQQSGGAANSDQVYKCVAGIAPGVEETLSDINKKDMKGGSFDDTLFRGFLDKLNTDTGKNLSPFFIELDESDSKLIRVSVS